MNTLGLLLNALGGAATGYITNNLAINMLFKNYGPLGGVILKTRDEFITNTSQLVEREIINHHTLEDELSREEFVESFRVIVSDILKGHVPRRLQGMSWSRVPGLDRTLDNFLDYIEKNGQDVLCEALEILLGELDFQKITEASGELEKLIDELMARLFQRLEESGDISKILEQLSRGLEESGAITGGLEQLSQEQEGSGDIPGTLEQLSRLLEEKQLKDFLSPELLTALEQGLQDVIADLPAVLESEYSAEVEQLLGNLYQQLDVSGFLHRLEQELKNSRIARFVPGSDRQEKLENLEQALREFLQSKEGYRLLDQLLAGVCDYLQQVDFSLFDLLTEESRTGVEDWINEHLPGLLEAFFEWLEENDEQLEGLIEETLEEVLQQGSGFRNILKRIIYRSFRGRVVDRYLSLDRLLAGLEGQDTGELGRQLTDITLEYLRDQRPGKLLEFLQNQGLLDRQQLLDWIQNHPDLLINLQGSVGHRLLELRPGKLLKVNLTELFEEKYLDKLLVKIKEDFLFTPRFSNYLGSLAGQGLNYLAGLPLKRLISREWLERHQGAIERFCLTQLQENRRRLAGVFAGSISTYLAESERSIPDHMLRKLAGAGNQILVDYLQQVIADWKTGDIRQSYNFIREKLQLNSRMPDLLLELINNNLSRMMEGKIEKTVASNLQGLPDRDIQQAVEAFMGNELRPITRLGALLGGIGGSLLYLGSVYSGVSLSPVTGLGLSMFVYGFVGYFTNVLALKMIFQPYEKKEIAGIPLPYTPGVVARNKQRFARALGRFIDEELLDSETVDRIFQEQRDQLSQNLKRFISRNDYRLVFSLLNYNRDLLADRLVDYSLSGLYQKPETAASSLVRSLSARQLKQGGFNWLQSETLFEAGVRGLQSLLASQSEAFYRALQSGETLESRLPDTWKTEIKGKLLRLLEHTLDQLQSPDNSLTGFMSANTGEMLFQELSGKTPGDYLDRSQQQGLITGLSELIVDILSSAGEGSGFRLQELLEKGGGQTRSLADFFPGQISGNTEPVIEFLLARLQGYLQQERGRIKKLAVSEVRRELESDTGPGAVLKRGIYGLADMETTIKKVIDALIDDKLPHFLQQKQQELAGHLDLYLDQLLEKTPAELDLEFAPGAIKRLLPLASPPARSQGRENERSNRENFDRNRQAIEDCRPLSRGLVKGLTGISFNSLLGIMGIEDSEDFSRQIHQGLNQFSDNLRLEQADSRDLIKTMTPLATGVMESLIFSRSTADLTAHVQPAHLEQSLQQTRDILLEDPVFREIYTRTIEKMGDELAGHRVEELIDTRSLQEVLLVLFNNLTQGSSHSQLEDLLKRIVADIIGNSRQLVVPSTRDFARDLILESTLDAVEGHFLELLNTIDLRKITEEEVDKMQAREIEELFYSFAGRYLTRLKQYGWFGSGVGLLAELLGIIW